MPIRGGKNRTVAQIDKDAKAVELRRRHLTYRQIAQELGLKTPSGAYAAVKRGIADSVRENAEEVRKMELERLDDLSRTALRVMLTPHYVVHGGELIKHPETGNFLIDDGPVLGAIDRLIKIGSQRMDLLGLRMPVQVNATVQQVDPIDPALRELIDLYRGQVAAEERTLRLELDE